MRKSISKLIVAGLSLLMSVTATAGVNMTMKDSKTKAGIDNAGVTAVLPARQGKQVKGIQRPTRKDVVKGNPIATVGTMKMKSTKGASALQIPAYVPAASSDLYGVSYYADDFDVNPVGLYTLSTSETSNNVELVAESDVFSDAAGICVGQGVLYVNVLETSWGYIFGAYHCVYDLETLELIDIIDVIEDDDMISQFGTDITFDKTSGLIYGCYYDETGAGFMFASQDPTTFKTTKIADLEDKWFGCAAAADGTIYAIDAYGQLVKADKHNGDITIIGDTGFEPQYLTSATIDPKTNVMYFSLSPADENGYLTTIDLATGKGTILYEFEYENEFIGLGFDIPAAEAGAAAAPENFKVEFEGDLRTGLISFNMPTTTADDQPIYPAAYQYTVVRNGEVIKEGTALFGSEVKFVEVVPASGKYTYQAYVTNEAGEGLKAKTTLWVGPDAPVAPGNVALSYADGQFTVEWTAPQSGVNTDAVPEDVTYSVALMKDGAMVYFIDEIEGTSVSFDYDVTDDLTLYSAVVVAKTPRASSEIGASNTVAIGHVMTPYLEEFEDVDALGTCTVIDANEDGTTWQFFTQGIVRVMYNYSDDMDDWLITPPIYLETGKEYTFSVKIAAASKSYVERFEVMMGTEPTATGLDVALIDPTELTEGSDFKVYKAAFVAEETGDFYFGVHGISDADMYYMQIDYISVSAGVSAQAPVAPEINVVADVTGELQATVNYVAPKVNLLGEETTVSKIIITCDGEAVAVNDNVTAGEAYSVVVPVDVEGMHEFTATAYNEYGVGRVATASVFVGVNRPGIPENLVLVPTANVGEVTATWEAPSTDINGYPMNPDLVTYTVIDNEGEIIAEGITETSITYQASDGTPAFAYCGVYAETIVGYSEYPAVSNVVAVGTPYEMPYVESFDDGYLSHIVAVSAPEDSSAQWGALTDAELVDDFDGTNGCLVMQGQYVGDSAELYTGRIQLNDNPALSFAYFAISDECENMVNVFVTDYSNNQTKLAKSIVLKGGPQVWIPVMVSLDEYAGKEVSLIFEGVVMTHVYIMLDQIKVYSPVDYDLAVVSATAPALVAPDQEFEVAASIANSGYKASDAYKVELILNGETVDSVDCEALASGQIANVAFTQTLSPASEISNIYVVKVVYAADQATDNNVSGECPVYLDVPNYPTVSDLKATLANGVALSWSAPNLDPANLPAKAVTDDFESYESFVYEALGDWTLVDNDGAYIGGVQGINFPNIVLGETTCAYFVMNTEEAGLSENDAYAAHSGVQYLVSTFDYNSAVPNDDWLISPELSGDSQTISFYAKSFSSQYAETFSVYYSTTDTELSSFEKIGTASNIPETWSLYSVQLPKGAKYFAIVCESYDRFMFFVDDVTYIPANGEPMELNLVGYNIYRNGVKINAAPVAETSYVDAEGSANDEYVVTVVYAEGESAASNRVSAAASADPGVTGIDAALAANVKVEVVGRTIVITGAQGEVNVFTADGKALYNEAAKARNSVNVLPGVYVVKAGKLAQKVVVK